MIPEVPRLPLAGYRVLELAHLIAGPACGMYLADMGADVVKVESPAEGDASRHAYSGDLGGESAVFLTVNRNSFRTLAPPVTLGKTPAGIRTPAPALGEHTDAVLGEAGLDAGEIAALRRGGVVG